MENFKIKQEAYQMNSKSLKHLASDLNDVAVRAAIACYDWVGRGEEKSADRAAVESMRENLNQIPISGCVVIGEGERDEAPMLYIGEEVGAGGIEVDIALDPLEGTTICANNGESSLAVVAFANRGCFLNAPDVYMEKIAVGGGLPEGVINLEDSPKQNLQNLALAKKCNIADLTALILSRPRHEELIAKVRETGARVKLIGDGDIAGVISCTHDSGVDIYMGIGGAPEGVLAAAAIRTIGGQMMGRLVFNNDLKQIQRASKMGIKDLNKIYKEEEMARGNVLFACAGVTDGFMLSGVKKTGKQVMVNSLILDSQDRKSTKILTKFYQ